MYMKEKFNIDQPHLRENPYIVPQGYFNSLQDAVSEKISSEKKQPGTWSVVKPQLALVSSFAVIFLMGYVAVRLFTPTVTVTPDKNISAESEYFEGNFMETSFIDFYDSAKDSLLKEEQVDPNEIVEYLNTNASSVYIASLE
jgi:hypothetical protein